METETETETETENRTRTEIEALAMNKTAQLPKLIYKYFCTANLTK